MGFIKFPQYIVIWNFRINMEDTTTKTQIGLSIFFYFQNVNY